MQPCLFLKLWPNCKIIYNNSETKAKGALHAGHLSLIQMASQQTNCTVVSIFVNPTQFNEKDDFEKYPRPVERDMELLASHTGCNLLFLPDVAEVYPSGLPPQQPFDLGEVALPMEGKSRPGHFNGVAQVVNRLLNIVQPTALFMGQKDFQQVAVVRRLLALTNSTVRLVACPTLRATNTTRAPNGRCYLRSPAMGSTAV